MLRVPDVLSGLPLLLKLAQRLLSIATTSQLNATETARDSDWAASMCRGTPVFLGTDSMCNLQDHRWHARFMTRHCLTGDF